MKGKRHPMQTLGVLLRELRQSRNFTQERMAGQAHVTTRAIQYWESDRQIPHDVELENLLCALELTTEQRQAVYGLLPEPRSLRLLSRLAGGEAAFATAGRLPGLGDLIRAMRVRRGWTDEQFAREMQVARSTVLRWEATQVLPSDEDMTRLCRLLRASAEEETALQSRRLHRAV
jgi:transcriptional regulator with XRE-family HTH domain